MNRLRPLVCLILGFFTLITAAFGEESPNALGSTLGRIVARQALYVGYREAALPFSYLLPRQSTPTGYFWDICSHVFKAVEDRLGKAVPVVPVAVTDNARTMMLKTGITDLDCGAAGNTVGRQKQVSFSTNVYVSEIKVMVSKNAGFTGFEQLADKRVVTVAGGTAERHIKLAALSRNITLQHVLANTPADAMAVLANGGAEAYVAEDAVLVAQRASSPGDFVLLDAALATEPFAIMLPKDDPVWKKLVDDTLATLMQSGELARIYDKWFMNPIPPAGINLNLPMSELLKAAIQQPDDTPVN